MGYALGKKGVRSFSTKDTAQKHDLGYKDYDNVGNEFIYMKGVANLAVGDIVTYDANTFQTTRLTKAEADKLKPMAVAMAAAGASEFGWFQVYGVAQVSGLASCAKEVAMYTSATAGATDDDATSQTKINRMVNLTAIGGSAALSPMFIAFPSAG